jgi:hypothetical protein
MAKGITHAQYEKWNKLGRPETFTYRGKTIDTRMFKTIYGTDYADNITGLVMTPKELKAAYEKSESKLSGLQKEALELWKKDESHAHKLGTVLHQIKVLLPHGAFGKWCEEEGLTQSRVSYCLQLAHPEGDKVAASKKRLKLSPRTRTITTFVGNLRALYDAMEKRDADLAEGLYKDLRQQLDEMLAAAKQPPQDKPSPKLKAKAAGA